MYQTWPYVFIVLHIIVNNREGTCGVYNRENASAKSSRGVIGFDFVHSARIGGTMGDD